MKHLWILYFIHVAGQLARTRAECGKLCSCESAEPDGLIVTCRGNNVTQVPVDIPAMVTKLYLSGTDIRHVPANAFVMYPYLTELFFRDTSTEPCKLEEIEPGAFNGLPRLGLLGLIGCIQLTYIGPGVLGKFNKLDTIHIYRSGLLTIPDMSQFETLNPDMNGIMREIDFQNNKIEIIRTNDFRGITTGFLKLQENQISSVGRHAFVNSTIVNLTLKANVNLKDIDDLAFDGINNLHQLDLSNTQITNLPTKGLKALRHLVVKNTPTLKHFPSVLEFEKIEQAELTYPHHCCAFKNPQKQNPLAWKAKKAQELIDKECDKTTSPLPPVTQPGVHMFLPNPDRGLMNTFENPTNGDIRVKRQEGGFQPIISIPKRNNSDPPINEEKGFPSIEFHTGTVPVDQNLTHRAECGKIYIYNPNIDCTPEPDAFNPCEDVMGYVWLRVIVWFVLVAALLGNSIVLVILTTSRGKFTVPKFLMCNLAFADFIMGVYLILLASIDIRTLGEYFNHAVAWQNEGGCQAAGFLSVFSSELSVFTLTILTLERWYAISHAIHLNKRLKLRQSIGLMVCGYSFATILALLPLFGISGYGNVSICLPMKADNGLDIGYVVSLLVMNGVMFLAICFCYISMYLKVKGSATTARSNDATIAKRMALLVFTNFACWAPIAFFGLTASAGVPLIDITHSKILLVFFYPINSCANPFLYAILTRQFRKDVFILLGKFGICVERANMYRGTYTSRTLSNSKSQKEFTVHRLHRYSESVFSHLNDNNHTSKHLANGNLKVHPKHRESAEAQPFIAHRSHLDRAADFANKEPILAGDDVTLDNWEFHEHPEPYPPKCIRSVSDYVRLNDRKTLVNGNPSNRKSVDTFLSSSTDTTYISDTTHLSEDIWQMRKSNEKDICVIESNITKESYTIENQNISVLATSDEEVRISHENCYTLSSDIDSCEVFQRLVLDEIIEKDNEYNDLSNHSTVYVNRTDKDLRMRFHRSPSLSSPDETAEFCADHVLMSS